MLQHSTMKWIKNSADADNVLSRDGDGEYEYRACDSDGGVENKG